MTAMVFLLACLQDSLIIVSSDRVFRFLFPLQHLYNLFLKKQRAVLPSYLVFLLFLGQSVAHAPLQHCQCLSKIMSISLLQCIFSQTVWCLRFQIRTEKPQVSVLQHDAALHKPCHKVEVIRLFQGSSRQWYWTALLGQLQTRTEPTPLRNVGFLCRNPVSINHSALKIKYK